MGYNIFGIIPYKKKEDSEKVETDLEPDDFEQFPINKIWVVHWYSYYREYNVIKTKRNTRPFDNEREAMEFKEKLEIARKFLKDQTTANVEIETYEK